MTERLFAPITAVLGGAFTVLGIWAALAPRSFTAVLADFGPYNPHLVHDFAAASAAVGIAVLTAVRMPGWRAPVLTVAALWNGLHALSHVVDIGDAASSVVGWAEVLLLSAGTALLAFLAAAAPKTLITE